MNNTKIFLGYAVDTSNVLCNAPCACPGCQDAGEQQPGHVYCSVVPEELLQAQEDKKIIANLDSAGWFWTMA